MTAEQLLAAFEADDAEALLRILPTASDEDRSAAWSVAVKRLRSRRWHDDVAALDVEARQRRTRTQALLCLGAGPPDVVRVVGGFVFGVPDERDFRAVLDLRTPGWKRDFAAASLRTWTNEKEVGLFGPWWWDNWLRVRHFERTGVVPFNGDSGDYLVVFVRGLTFSDPSRRRS